MLNLGKKEDAFILVDFNKAMLNETKQNVKNVIGFKASEIFVDKRDIIESINTSYREKSQFQKPIERNFCKLLKV